MISVIVPIYNEEKILSENSLHFQNLSQNAELIFVDGQSTDRSREIASKYGRVFLSEKGRALQMNFGAKLAQQEILLFLHSDTTISCAGLSSVEAKIKEHGYIGGCFTQRIDKKGFIYRLIEWQGNIRARITKEFYGDQGIFVKKTVFLRMNGFPHVPIMEDVLFTRKLRSQGKTIVLADKIIASLRRWDKNGVIKTILLYNMIIVLFLLKVPLKKIKTLYGDLR